MYLFIIIKKIIKLKLNLIFHKKEIQFNNGIFISAKKRDCNEYNFI